LLAILPDNLQQDLPAIFKKLKACNRGSLFQSIGERKQQGDEARA
jgi:hypothetical protein